MTERLSDELLTELHRIAETATTGPWEADGNEVSQHWSRPEPWAVIASNEVACMAYCYGGSGRGVERSEDAEHIVAFDPPTVLAMLDELGEAREEITRLRMATTIVQSSVYTAQQIGGSVQATAEALTRHAAMHSIDRAEQAEGKLARIRDFVAEHAVGADDPFAYGQQVARAVLAILDGSDT